MPSFPLSVLVDRLAGESGARDEAFVRALTQWLHAQAPHLRLAVCEALQLRDVVVTFQMKRRVKVIVTGYPPGELPGEVTVTIDEREFPRVELRLTDTACSDPYELCTLDYSLAGRRVRVTGGERAGAEGVLVVAATVGTAQQNRVQLDTGEVVTLDGEVLAFAG